MAKIMAGVGCSHVPAIGVAMDTGITHEEYWKPVFKGFKKFHIMIILVYFKK